MRDEWPVTLRRVVLVIVATFMVSIVLVTIENALGIGEWHLLLNQIPTMLVWRRVWDWSATRAPSEAPR